MTGKKTILVLIGVFVFSITQESSASPVFGKVFDLRQPDGSTVKVKIWGDEFYQVVESMNGYTLIRDPKNLRICYAKLSNKGHKLLSTGVPIELPLPAKINIRRHLRINKSAVRAKVNAAKARFTAGKDHVISTFSENSLMLDPTRDNVRGICLIVDFPDEPATIPALEIKNFCNQQGYTGYGNNGSIRDYFYDVSGTTPGDVWYFTPEAQSDVYEAEDAVLNGPEITSIIGGYIGTGFVDYINPSNDYIKWTVNVATSGQYKLQFRYALAYGDRPLEIRVNGEEVESSLSFPVTDSWSTWDTFSIVVDANNGDNTVQATAIGFSGPNIDHLKIINNN